MNLRSIVIGLILALAMGAAVPVHSRRAQAPAMPEIVVLRTPSEGIQPQTVVDREGVVHMIYFIGDATEGDIQYVRREPGANDFSKPVRVNSDPKSAVAVGTVRGPQLAVGRNGRVYVIWFGSRVHNKGSDGPMPVFFSRQNDSGTAFEPQRNLMVYAQGGDGGLSIAANTKGEVYAVWHARGSETGESHRRVYLARSRDDGKTFAREIPISPAELGACGCCGMRALVDHRGTVYVLYRAAAESIHRDMTLLVSADHGGTFRAGKLDPWELSACPMTTAYLSESRETVLAAWEKAGEVYFDKIDPRSFKLLSPIAAPSHGDNRKHPAVAGNANGQVLLAWTEGTRWEKGGSLAWQLFNAAGEPIGLEGHAPDLRVWGLPSVFANRQGNFTIVF